MDLETIEDTTSNSSIVVTDWSFVSKVRDLLYRNDLIGTVVECYGMLNKIDTDIPWEGPVHVSEVPKGILIKYTKPGGK